MTVEVGPHRLGSPGLGPHRLGSPGFVERETEKNLRTLEQGADDEDEADLLPPTMKTKLWNTRRWTVDSADLLPPETKPKPPWLLFVMAVGDDAKAKSGFLPKFGRERREKKRVRG